MQLNTNVPVHAAPVIGTDGKFQLPLAKVRVGIAVAEDEVDLDSGFLMVPSAIPQPAEPPVPPTTPPGPPGGPQGPGPKVPTTPGPPGADAKRTVELHFSADRNKLYSAWPALANLADMAGSVTVAVRAESDQGFDPIKLQNGVLEPLQEADLIE
jgi:hypothetical protein